MTVPNQFGTATSAIPLSQLDANFNTPITLGNTAIQLGDTVTTLNNMTLANVTISSGTITITNVAVTTANVSGTANISTLVVVGNATVGGNTTITGNITAANANVTTNLVLSGGTANGVAYLNTSKVLTTGSALVFDGTNLGVGTNSPGSKLTVSDGTVTAGLNPYAPDSVCYFGTTSNHGLAFLTNGSERMRLTSTSLYTASTINVGIGTSSPTRRLDVRQAYTADTIVAQIGNTNNGNGATPVATIFDFTEADGTSVSRISSIYTQNTGKTDLAFGTYNGGLAEKMRLDASGNLGLGVTPSLWTSVFKAVQVKQGSISVDSSNNTTFANNCYFDGSNWKYINTAASQQYLQYAGQHIWNTAPSGTGGVTPDTVSFTQAMTLDASGNLGIGNTTPSYKLDVSGYIRGVVSNASVGNASSAQFVQNSTGDAAISFLIGATTEWLAGVDNSDSDSFKINAITGGGDFNGTGITLTTSGNLLVGSSSTIGTGGRFQVTSSADTAIFKSTAATTFAAIVSNVEDTAARLMAFQYGSGGSPTNVGTITTNGTGVTYGTSSDYRLKENIVPMTGALDKVAQLKPVTYKWKINGADGQGFIAHELAEVVPDAVQGEKDAVNADGNPTYQGIDTSYLVATLTAAIQEQQALITQLTARITALEGA